MNMKQRRGAWILAVAAIGGALLAAPAWASHTQGITKDSIKIGFFGPITGPGYLWGKLVMNGAQIVYNEVNRTGGIHGRKIATLGGTTGAMWPPASRP